jgi:ABC-type iron transport system FetAB ATPase subunit
MALKPGEKPSITLKPGEQILITGPSGAKTDLVKHMAKRVPQVFSHIVGIESSDHPTDGQLLAHARHYFKAADRKIPQKA